MLQQILQEIPPVDAGKSRQAQEAWDNIAKPLHSLGKLEDLVCQMAGIYRTLDFSIAKKGLLIFCADNGVVEEGVSQTGQEVTGVVAENFLDEQSCAAIMCKRAGVTIRPIDIGMIKDTPRVEKRKVCYGTRNMTKEPAMTREEAIRGIETGITLVQEMKERGYRILAIGEMGIGNTTTSSAMTSIFLNLPVEEVTGRGAGLSDEGLSRKKEAIRKAIALHHPNAADPVDVLAKVGGLDIAGMAGVCIGGAYYGIPVVLDGFIAKIAALTAVRCNPLIAGYLLASHRSAEGADALLTKALALDPILDGRMCLGEGSGAVALFPLLDMAVSVFQEMGTFGQHHIRPYVSYEKAPDQKG